MRKNTYMPPLNMVLYGANTTINLMNPSTEVLLESTKGNHQWRRVGVADQEASSMEAETMIHRSDCATYSTRSVDSRVWDYGDLLTLTPF